MWPCWTSLEASVVSCLSVCLSVHHHHSHLAKMCFVCTQVLMDFSMLFVSFGRIMNGAQISVQTSEMLLKHPELVEMLLAFTRIQEQLLVLSVSRFLFPSHFPFLSVRNNSIARTVMKCHDLEWNPLSYSFEDCCEHCKLQSLQFQFWHHVLSMELVILIFIRSLREANFSLYHQALCELILYLLTKNNVNYAWWLPIHLLDVMALEEGHR